MLLKENLGLKKPLGSNYYSFQNNANRQHSAPRNRSNVSFKGFGLSGNTLNTIGRLGADPTTSNLVSTVGYLGIRPPITMLDKNTPKEERKYSAIWQAGIAVAGLAVQLVYNSKFGKFANFLAQKVLGTKLNPTEMKLANQSSALVEAIQKAPDEARRIIKMLPKAAEQLAEDYDKVLAQKSKPTAKSILSALNPLNIFKHTPVKNPFAESPGLIGQLKDEYADTAGKMGKKVVDGLIDSPQRAKKILEVSGTSKLIHFTVLLVSLNMATLLVTKYMKPVTNFIGEKLNIEFLKDKKAKKEDNNTNKTDSDKDKKKLGAFDKGVIVSLATLALIGGANVIGKLVNKKNWGDIAVGKVAKTLNEKLHIGQAFDKLLKKPSEWARKKSDWLAGQANINDKWVERNVIANLFLRLGITAPTIPTNPNALYNTVRLVNDELMNITLLNAADKAVIKPASRGLAKSFKTKPYNEGVKVIVDQGVKNILLVCTVMGFLNNTLSHKVMGFMEKHGLGKKDKKENKEKKYQDFRRSFLATQKMGGSPLVANTNLNGFERADRLIKTMDLSMIKT